MGYFDDYLTGVQGQLNPQASSGNPFGSIEQALAHYNQNVAGSSGIGNTWGGDAEGGAGSSASASINDPGFISWYNNVSKGASGPSYSGPKGTSFIGQGMKPAYGFVTGGSGAAAGLLRQGYEDAFRARAAGYAGEQGELERAAGAAASSQGLNPEVARRMLSEQKARGLQGLAGARGELSLGLNTDLASLAKGTGTELAGLKLAELTNVADYSAASKGAKAAKSAGVIGGIGSAIGGLAGAAVFGSERWLKENVIKVGEFQVGGRAIGIYEYDYIKSQNLEGRYRGFMVEELEPVAPQFVAKGKTGIRYVDYDHVYHDTGFVFGRVGIDGKLMIGVDEVQPARREPPAKKRRKGVA